MSKPMKVRNSKGEVIVLNKREAALAQILQNQMSALKNALGYEINITTLTTIVKQISEQKFFEVAPADYLPVRVGEGAWSQNLTTYRSFSLSDDFSTGIINTGANNDRLAQADAGVDSVNVLVKNWAKSIGWALPELMLASKSGNWDVVSAKEESRKKNWDLGIQKVAFLGLSGDSSVQGLLNMSGITNDTTTITKPISSMSVTELKAFIAALVNAYRANCSRTAWPSVFIIPESDYLGLSSQASPDFPVKSTLELLEESLKLVTRNPGFKVLPLAYGDVAYNSLTVQRYVMHSGDEKSLRMDIPVDYTSTLANSLDNFSFQNAAYGQFTGVVPYRPAETLYFSFTPA